MSKFKTKWEYEEEDSINHQKRLENLKRRRDLKRAEGFKRMVKFDTKEAGIYEVKAVRIQQPN